MKRAAVALVMLGFAAGSLTPASAATTVYGSAQLKYTVNATAAVSIAVNYDPTTGSIKNAVAGSILPSTAGLCAAAVPEGTNATLTFGAITPGAGYTGCYYKDAISIGVLSNDLNGVKIIQYLDVAPVGTAVCIYPQGTANTLAALPAASGTAGNPAAYTGAACPTVNSVAGNLLSALGAATAGTGFGAAGAPAGVTTDVTATPTATTYTAGGTTVYNGTAGLSGVTYKYMGEDVQMNVNGSAASGAATSIITVAVIPL